MSSSEEKDLVLDNARHLRDTNFKNVGISADLTPMELQEEKDLQSEADRLNRNLNPDDRQKNLKWLVVGQKGSKRIIKGAERPQPASQGPPPTQQSSLHQVRDAAQGRSRISSKRGHSGTDSDDDLPSQINRSIRNAKQPRQQGPPHPPPPTRQATTDVEDEENQISADSAEKVQA